MKIHWAIPIGVLCTMATYIPASANAEPTAVNTKIVNPSGLYDPRPSGYSHAVVATGGEHIVFIAGQGGEGESGALAPEFSEQITQAYKNLRTALEAVNAKPSQVTKITTYVVDYDQSLLEVMAKHVRETFGDSLPAQTLVPVPRLAIDGMLFEVDAIAVID